MIWFLSRLLAYVVGLLVPSYRAFKLLQGAESGRRHEELFAEAVKLLQLFTVVSMSFCVCWFVEPVVGWFPFYYEVKFLFVLYLLFIGPQAAYRSRYVAGEGSLLREYEADIDGLCDKGKSAMWRYLELLWARGAHWARDAIGVCRQQHSSMDDLSSASQTDLFAGSSSASIQGVVSMAYTTAVSFASEMASSETALRSRQSTHRPGVSFAEQQSATIEELSSEEPSPVEEMSFFTERLNSVLPYPAMTPPSSTGTDSTMVAESGYDSSASEASSSKGKTGPRPGNSAYQPPRQKEDVLHELPSAVKASGSIKGYHGSVRFSGKPEDRWALLEQDGNLYYSDAEQVDYADSRLAMAGVPAKAEASPALAKRVGTRKRSHHNKKEARASSRH